MLKREGFDFEKFAKKAMQDTFTSRELFERMPTRAALAEPEVAAHKVRSYEDDSTDWAPSGGSAAAAAADQPAQPARRRPVRSTRNRDPVITSCGNQPVRPVILRIIARPFVISTPSSTRSR